MAASTLIRFDTTPPTLTFGQAARVGSSLRVPFETDEIATVTATASSPGIGDVEVVVEPDEIVVPVVPGGAAVINFVVEATDDVGNEAVEPKTVKVIKLDLAFPLTLTIVPTGTPAQPEFRQLSVETTLRQLIDVEIEPTMLRSLTIDPGVRTLSFPADDRLLSVMPSTLRSLTVDPTVLRQLGVSSDIERTLVVQDHIRNLSIQEE